MMTTSLSNMINYKNTDIVNMLKNIEWYVMQVSKQNISISNVGGDVNVTIVNKTKKVDNKKLLESWLQSNPIDEPILQSEYRQKFLDDTGCIIHANTFGKLASKYIQSMSKNGKGYYLNK